jgi:PPK2 family polyphosphate:nucleotide phosphotransferase
MAYAHRVKPGSKVDLMQVNPQQDDGLTKEEGQQRTATLGERLAELQELMYAAGSHSLLIVLQGRDTAGKDGSIRTLSRYLNSQGTHVASFKVPTELELSHDFLWRVHPHVPAKGSVTIFNRSHYEDVLVVRVHTLVPEPIWKARFDHINAFEKLLTTSNTILVKFMLHISPEEQEERLLAREQDPVKAWKLSVGDWKERAHWGRYTAAYEEALERCSPDDAPWFVVPANKKWFRDLAILETLVDVLHPYEDAWREKLEAMGTAAKEELAAYRAEHGGGPT